MWQASVNDSRHAESSSMQATEDFVSRCGGSSISGAPAFQLEDSKRQRVEQQKMQTVQTRKQSDAARKITQDAESTFFAWLAASKRRDAKPEDIKALEDAANEAMRREVALEVHTPLTPTEVVCTSDMEALAPGASSTGPVTASPEFVASSTSAEHVSSSAAPAKATCASDSGLSSESDGEPSSESEATLASQLQQRFEYFCKGLADEGFYKYVEISNDPGRHRNGKVGVVIEACKREPNSVRVLFPEASRWVQSFETQSLCSVGQADLESRFALAWGQAYPDCHSWKRVKPLSRFSLVK